MTTVRNTKNKTQGFTLIELLTVIVIISILAIVALGVQRASVTSTRAARTRTTIAKIDAVITSMYEKYQYRKVDVDQFSDSELLSWTNLTVDESDPLYEENLGKAKFITRTRMLRELLMMDMPTNYFEAIEPSFYNQISPLRESYCNALNTAYGSSNFSNTDSDIKAAFKNEDNKNINAELLYMIITNGDPESRTMFHDREIADTNNNGLNEFVDGWGNPIRFLRWAPAFQGSSRQPSADRIEEFLNNRTSANQVYQEFLKEYGDPLDPLEITSTDNSLLSDGWLVVPLIYSCGADEIFGRAEVGIVISGSSATPTAVCNNPFDPAVSGYKIPKDSSDTDIYIGLGATFNLDDLDDEEDEEIKKFLTDLNIDVEYTKDNITNHNFYNE